VATSAVREAENADEFIDRVRVEAGIVIDVVSGIEEARLIHLGVLQAVPVYDRRLLLIDIGGGSTEILVGERGETIVAGSLKLGAIRLTRRFFGGDRLHPGAVEACRRHIRSALVPMVREAGRAGFEVAIASSGTAETIASLVNSQRGSSTPRTFNNFTMSRDEIKAAVRVLIAASSVEERRAISGMDPSRADIILAGAIILEQAVEELGIDEIVISDNALREGVLLDALSRRRGATLHHLRDLRRRSVLHLAESMDDDVAHSMCAAGFALDLFDATASLHGLGDDSRELLEAGALLANVGLSISHSEHHKHSYYVIRHSDCLAGFTDREIEMIAQIARYHRKSAPKVKHVEFARLRLEDQDRVRILAGLLRVAIALDRSHKGRVAQILVSVGDESEPVSILVKHLDDVDVDLEVQTAEDRKGLLEDVLQRRVKIEAS
jgi:exopolyphosphatase/guanosine-5'-triphosphate,3'-diphosphate pyrophosphatase